MASNLTVLLTIIRGQFRVNQKGTKIFDLTVVNKNDVLIVIDWGGAFTPTRGIIPDFLKPQLKYYYRASSNGGGTGYTYLVLPADKTIKISEEILESI